MPMLVTNATILNSKGEILLFSLEYFIGEIAKGDSCFICGAEKDSKVFNNEHVIPDWVLAVQPPLEILEDNFTIGIHLDNT